MSSRWSCPGLILATLAGACSGSDRPAAPSARDAATPRPATDAAAPDPRCTAASIRAVRNRAGAELAAGRAAEAVRLLGALPCAIDGDLAHDRNAEVAWTISDLAIARYRAGDLHGCYATAESQLMPRGDLAAIFDDTHPVIQALRYNAALCFEALEAAWGTFASAACALDPDSHGIPTDALAGSTSCLAIAAGGEDAEGMWQCGAVTLISQPGGGRPARRTLAVPDSQLTNPSLCCKITEVGFARAGDALRIRVDGEGRACNEGTMRSTETTIYELRGDTLTVIDTVQAVYH